MQAEAHHAVCETTHHAQFGRRESFGHEGGDSCKRRDSANRPFSLERSNTRMLFRERTCSRIARQYSRDNAPAVALPQDLLEEHDDVGVLGDHSIAFRRGVVLPYHPLRTVWDWFLIIFVVYSAYTVPLQMCFNYETSEEVLALDWVNDVFFMFDILLNLRTAYDKEDGTYELDPVKIRSRYMSSWFPIDLMASIPFDRLFGDGEQTLALSLAKTPRLLRITRLLKKLEMITSSRSMRLVSVLIIFLTFTHFVGCFWWLVGRGMGSDGWQFQPKIVPLLLQDLNWEDEENLALLGTEEQVVLGPDIIDPGAPTWLPPRYNATALLAVYTQRVGVGKLYVTSLYWALTMVMKSPWLHPSSTGEQIFGCGIVILAAIMFAYFLGNVTSMIQSYEKSNSLHRDQMATINSFVRQHEIPKVMRRRLVTYTDAYFKARVEGVENKAIINGLPAHVRPQVLIEVYRDLLTEHCPTLLHLSFTGGAAVLQLLTPEVCLKSDYLVRAGTQMPLLCTRSSGAPKLPVPNART